MSLCFSWMHKTRIQWFVFISYLASKWETCICLLTLFCTLKTFLSIYCLNFFSGDACLSHGQIYVKNFNIVLKIFDKKKRCYTMENYVSQIVIPRTTFIKLQKNQISKCRQRQVSTVVTYGCIYWLVNTIDNVINSAPMSNYFHNLVPICFTKNAYGAPWTIIEI